ncbi:unnamed protein product [Peronospora destructor]|uniref:Cation/H+ exchanger domain-containing protein n=1 Tax=Peronospora destructor TaxID=86335 RepID=A0AAV0TJL7_9STRA|nr:unnamed protein product [Peronospora destructor]
MKPRHLSLLVAALTAGAIIAVNATAATSLLASKRFLEEEKKDNDELVPFYSWDNVPETLSYLLAFVLVLLGAHPLGLFFPKYFGLPLITGYMVAGILSGPFLSNLLSVEAVTMFRPYVNAFALSFISLQAGQEIYLPELRPQLKSIAALLLTYYCTAMVIGTTIFMLAANAFFYADLATSCQVGIALMFASISVLVSPSTVMALKIEIDSVGPFTHLALGTCMMAEFVVLVSFSVSRVIASIYCAKLDVSAASITFTMGVVLTNVVLGVYLGLVTFLIFQIPSGVPDEISKLPAHHGASHVKKIECTDGKLEMSDLEQALKSHDRADLPHTTYVEEVESNMRVNKHGWTEGKALLLKGFIWLLMGYVFYLFTNTLSDITTAHFGLIWQVKFEALLVLMNSMQDRQSETPVDSAMQKADVLIFTGVPERTLQQAKVIQTMLGKNTRGPRLIAVVDDCAAGARLRELGVLTVQPSIALGNIVTRLALLDAPLAAILSKELSSMSAFSIAAYFRGDTDELRESIPSLSELRLPLRRLALDRSVVNHHSVDYDRLAKALAAENLPMPPPPSRVSMFGTSAVRHDPFAKRSKNLGAQEHYVVEDDDFDGSNNCSIFEKQFLVPSPNSSAGGGDRMRSSRLSRRRSRLESSSSSLGGGAGFVTLHRDKSTGL